MNQADIIKYRNWLKQQIITDIKTNAEDYMGLSLQIANNDMSTEPLRQQFDIDRRKLDRLQAKKDAFECIITRLEVSCGQATLDMIGSL